MSDERTCFGCLHVKTATWIIAIVHTVMSTITAINAVRQLYYTDADDSNAYWSTVAMAILSVLWLCFCILLMIGLWKSNANFILPHLIASVAAFIMYLVQVVNLVLNSGFHSNQVESMVWTAIVCIVIALLLWIEYRCYQFLRAFP